MSEKIMAMHNGNKLCQWCRKMFPKKEVRFYPKADMKMCGNCVEMWEGKHIRQLTGIVKIEKTYATDMV